MKQRNYLRFMAVAAIILILTGAAFVPSANAGVINLPQTGQTTSIASGDDGDLQMGVAWPNPRFQDNGDGTITDLLTGLMWAANSSGSSSFYNAMTAINASNLGNHTDWRMANIREMESLLTNAEVPNIAAWLNSLGLGFNIYDGSDGLYWTSTSYAAESTEGWAIRLSDARLQIHNEQDPYYSWPWNQSSYTHRGTCSITTTKQCRVNADCPSGETCEPTGEVVNFHYLPVRAGANDANDPTYPANIPKTGRTTQFYANDDGALQRGVTWPSPRVTNLDGSTTGTCSLELTACTAPKSVSGDCDNWCSVNTAVKGCYTDLDCESYCSQSGGPCNAHSDCPGGGNRCTPVETCMIQNCVLDDDVVVDKLTGLMWLTDPNCMLNNYPGFEPNDYKCTDPTYRACTVDADCNAGATCSVLQPPDGSVAWQVALDFVAGINNVGGTPGTDYFPLCGGGYSDWRLPNRKEMWSLLTVGLRDPLPGNPETSSSLYLTDQGFTNWLDHRIWTSTVRPEDTSQAFTILSSIRSPEVASADRITGRYKAFPVRSPLNEPDILVSPEPLDFSDVVQGTESNVTLTVNNNGGADLSIISIAQNDTIDPPFSIVSGQDTCSGTVVAPGASCTFDVRFSPIGRGAYNDTFDIASNDPDTSTFIVSITGTGKTAFLTELPQTGQSTSYSIADDGDIMAGVAWPSPRFTNPDGTTPVSGEVVLDQLTGLYWQKDGNASGLRNFDNGLTYCEGLSLTDNNAVAYNDFRMPNMLELESMINFGFSETSFCSGAGCSSNAAWLNDEGFQDVQDDNYWVSSAYAGVDYAGAWRINFDPAASTGFNTRPDNYDWSATYYILCARGGADDTPGGFPAEVRKTGQTTSLRTYDDGWFEWGISSPSPRFVTPDLDMSGECSVEGTACTAPVASSGDCSQKFCTGEYPHVTSCTVDADCLVVASNSTCNVAQSCTLNGDVVNDNLTGLMWTKDGSLVSTLTGIDGMGVTQWDKALDFVDYMNTGQSFCSASMEPCSIDADCPGSSANGYCTNNPYNTCNVDSDCAGAELCLLAGPETCLTAPDNYGYTDWRLPNFKEFYESTVNFEGERMDDDLAAYGFANVGGKPTTQPGRGCGIWTSTTDPLDSTRAYSSSFGWAAGMIRSYPKDTAGTTFCGVGQSNPYIVWPVRTASAPPLEPNISIAPSSYDFGNVAVGVTSNTVFTVENLGLGDLDITSVSIPASDFSVQSEDCTTLSPLAQNDTCSISVDFTPSAESVMTEDLSVISDDPDTPVLTAGLTGTGIPAIIDLELSKTVDNPTPVEGGTVLFTVAVTNNGPADATGVAIEDVVPNGYSNIQNISNGGIEAGGTITWSGLSIANGAAVNLTFNVDVNASGNYVNVAQVTAVDLPLTDSDSTPNNDDGDQSEDDEDNESVSPVAVIIDLSLDKTADNSTPFVGDSVTFTVAVTNSGPSDATGVSVEDVVPSGFSNIRNINYGGAEAGGTITWSGLNINSGVTRNLSFTADVDPDGNYTNIAQVTAAVEPDIDSAPNNDNGDQSEDDEDNESVSPVFGIDLELDKSASNSSPDMGSTVTFTIAVTNNGYLDATGVSVQDVVPDGYSNIQNISNGGTEAGSTITWSGLNINMGSIGWYDTGWNYRQKITINSSQVPGDLSSFPVLISTTDTNLIVAPGGNVGKANGGDILFTNSDGTQKFDHEIERYNSTTGDLVAWVKVPNLSSSVDTVIHMYYGNAGAADQWNTNGTWDGNYAGVWHFKAEQAGTGNLALYQDSTANNNHGDDYVSATGQDGKIDRGQEFDGIDDYVSMSDSPSLDITNQLTFEAWIRNTSTNHQVLADKRELTRNPPGWWRFSIDNADDTYPSGYSFQVSNTNWWYVDWSTPIGDNTWHHVVGVMNGQIQIYVDGILRNQVNNFIGNMTPNNAPLLIGKWIGDAAYYEGFIDEVRVSDIARSADWIETSYNNQNNPSSFTNFDAQEVFTQASTTNLTFDADVTASGNYLNVAQVMAADQPDSDSTPDNDNGDQSEDDEDNAIVVLPGSSYSVLNQPRTNPGDPYPCNLWYSWCDPARGGSWPSTAVYAATWDDPDITGGYAQVVADNFNLAVETTITEIRIWGGYWYGDVPPAVDNFTLVFHDDAGGTIGTMVAQPAFTLNRVDTGIRVPMPYSATQSGNSLIFEYTLTLTETLTLAPGTYWVEVFNDTTGHTNNNDFFWMWGYRDYIDGRGIEGIAWTTEFNAGGSGTNWNYDIYGNFAIEINGQAAGPGGCTLRVRNLDTLAEFCTINEAYVAAGEDETIQVKAESYTETLDFNIDKMVILQGGYDDTYSTVIGKTTIIGNMTSSNGSVTIGDFILE